MTGKHTLTIIKPHAVRDNKTGAILHMINDAGFKIIAMKMIRLTRYQAEGLYQEHRGRDFYHLLVEMMSSGPIVVALLDKENAVAEMRSLVGKTDPEMASPGTIRHLFGISMRENAIHASDGANNAVRECNFFFSEMDKF